MIVKITTTSTLENDDVFNLDSKLHELSRSGELKVEGNSECLKQVAICLECHTSTAAQRKNATAFLEDLARADDNQVPMFKLDGLMNAVVKAAGGGGDAQVKALAVLQNLSFADDNSVPMFKLDGLMNAVVKAAGGGGDAQVEALGVLRNLAVSADNKVPMFKLDGLMNAVVKAAGGGGDTQVNALAVLQNLACADDNSVPMFKLDGLMNAVVKAAGGGGDAQENSLAVLQNLAVAADNHVGLASFPSLLPTVTDVLSKDGQTEESRIDAVVILANLAKSPESARTLLTPPYLEKVILPMLDILKKAGPDPTKWKKGNSPESWANTFFMNAAQHDFALIPLRTRGVVEHLEPLLKINHYESLKASATIAYLVGGDAEGDKLELLKSATSSIDRIIDLLSNTLNLKGGQGYKYGVFPLHSSVRAISILATNDDLKKYLLTSDKAVLILLVRVLREFVSDTGGGSAGGGGKDKLSAELAASALLKLAPNQNDDEVLDLLAKVKTKSKKSRKRKASDVEDVVKIKQENDNIKSEPVVDDDTTDDEEEYEREEGRRGRRRKN